MQKLRREHPGLCEGWKIVENKSDIVKKSPDLSLEELKKEMEKTIDKVVCKSVLEQVLVSGGDTEYGQKDQKENPLANRKTMAKRYCNGLLQQLKKRKKKLIDNEEWEEQFEEQKRKLIQNEDLKKSPDGLKTAAERKLMIVSGRLEVANNNLKLLLDEADKDTIKANIPAAARVKCFDAWSKANTICLRINQIKSEHKGVNIIEYVSTARLSLTRTKAAGKLLAATINSLEELQWDIRNRPQ